MTAPAVMETMRYHSLPVAGVESMRASTARSFPRHTHDQYGIGLVDHGGHSSWSGRGQVEAGPGTFISVNPGEVHDGRAIGQRLRSWRILYFDPATMCNLGGDVSPAAAAFEFSQPVFADPGLRSAFDAALTAGEAMACESALLILVAGLRAHSTRPARAEAPRAGVSHARQRIDDDPAAPVTLEQLASDCGLSRYQLLRAFAREFGLPPHAYLLQRRLSLARRLLRAGVSPVEAAATAGFSDQSHLTRCFGRQFGVTPGRYARRDR